MSRQEWFVYILRCADGSYYTGISTDVDRRVDEHNGTGSDRGARYTRSRRPVELVYRESCGTRSAALAREYRIKQLTQRQKLALIDQQ
ncbi:MAG: GIY-YIG nuclease family protein [Gammaproteobacteria bacterium]